MVKMNITLDADLLSQILSQLEYFAGANSGNIAPNTKKAVDFSARLIQKSWQNWALGGSLEGALPIKNASSRIASSIKINKQSDLQAEIYTESEAMDRIQVGQKAIDMKLTYPYGKKSRVSKKNIPYLIIPFSWGTPNSKGGARAHFRNAITPEIYKIMKAKSFRRSERTSITHFEENAIGKNIQRSEYSWGDRLNADGNMNGMVRMKTTTGSRYMTFRIISAKSPPASWWKKEIKANDVVGALTKALQPIVEDSLEAGLKADLGIDE